MATLTFEFRRSLTKSRVSTSLVLALFGPVMLALISVLNKWEEIPYPLMVIGIFQFLAIFLSVLLWATPVVFSELEGKTWTYIAIRPNGRLVSMVGKYLNAVFWAILTSVISLTLSCVVISNFPWQSFEDEIPRNARNIAEIKSDWMEMFAFSADPVVIWWCLFPAIVFGSMALSAIFVHVGLITHKRGMVFAVIYAIVETVFAFLPAIVRQFTVGFHMRNIAFKHSEFRFPDAPEGILTDFSAIWVHYVGLIIIALIHLGASIYWLHSREFITAEEA